MLLRGWSNIVWLGLSRNAEMQAGCSYIERTCLYTLLLSAMRCHANLQQRAGVDWIMLNRHQKCVSNMTPRLVQEPRVAYQRGSAAVAEWRRPRQRGCVAAGMPLPCDVRSEAPPVTAVTPGRLRGSGCRLGFRTLPPGRFPKRCPRYHYLNVTYCITLTLSQHRYKRQVFR